MPVSYTHLDVYKRQSFGLSPYSSEDEDGDRGDDWEDISNNNCSGDKLIACYEKALSGL